MRFLLDESAEARLAAFLTARGHDATRILITNDKDFGELVVRERHPHAGVILFRFPLDSTAHHKMRALADLLASHPARLD
jgi:predicted nuclease of predicted toxin-antitoxin system